MLLYEFLKNLLGLPTYTQTNNEEKDYRSQFLNPDNEYYENSRRSEHEDWNSDSDKPARFNVFTDPLEMHRYFEEQINEVLKTFGLFNHEGESFFDFHKPALGPSSEFNQVELPTETNLRDYLLKPGYHSTKDNNLATDTDVDGKVNVTDLDALLKNRSSDDKSLFQEKEHVTPHVRTFGQSITSKTVRGQDGLLETHRTVRDSAGNEETTITRQMGDKQYTVTVRTDKHGRQEKVEDMKNIDEQELARFTGNWRHLEPPQIDINSELNNWFDKMFK